MRNCGTQFVVVAIALSLVRTAGAQDPKAETLLSGLRHPTGVAVRPGPPGGPYEIYVSESGARRVVKVRSDLPNDSQAVITDFPEALPQADPLGAGNPLGLLFLTRGLLTVGGSGRTPLIHLFEIGEAAEPLAANQAKQRLAIPLPDSVTEEPYGSCIGLSRSRPNDQVPDLLLVAVVGDQRYAQLWESQIRAGTLSEAKPVTAKPESNPERTPLGLAVGEQGFIVVAEKSVDPARPPSLAFQSPTSGTTVMRLPLELQDVLALAYSPKSGNLYALALSLDNPDEGGVYRIDDASQPGRAACKAVRVLPLGNPTAAAFGPDGTLYVTAWNDADGHIDQGILVKITGEL